jgi:hypothetical protein
VEAEARVSADGKHCIVILPSDSRGYDGLCRCPTEMQLIDLCSGQVAADVTGACVVINSKTRPLLKGPETSPIVTRRDRAVWESSLDAASKD